MRQYFQTKCPALTFLVIVCAMALLTACKHSSYGSPDGYNLSKPEKMELGKVLNEISGITYDDQGDNLLAISDSKERIFEIKLKNKKLRDYTDKVVPSDSDLEDLVKVGDTVYLLMSKGVLKAVPAHKKDSMVVREYALGLPGQNDFETVYYDPSVKSLVLLCKTCANEKGKGVRTAYRFDLAEDRFDTSAFYTISKEEVKKALSSDEGKLDPSAAAINPLDKRLYILSSAGNLLIVTDTRGKVVEAYNLNPDLYPQAEGIAFAPNGDMYISNEGKFGKATIMFLPYHQKGKKTK
jgi:uncharacterized protein YjiK